MTGEQLREELARIAEGAPEVQVPDDTYRRGRRATWQARALVGAAAVACVAAVAAVTVPIVTTDRAQVAGGGGDRGAEAGVPDHIYAPPDGERPDLPLTPLDEVGPAVAGYLVDDIRGRMVLVTPEGRYRQVQLPDYPDTAPADVAPLLSPDGTQLAYAAEDLLSTYLRVVDLTTGESQRISLADDLGALVTSAQWSPSGDWLAWSGQRVSSRSGSARSYYLAEVGGVISVATGKSLSLQPGGRAGWSGLGVCQDGAAVRYLWPKFLVSTIARGDDEVRTWPRVVSEHQGCTPPQPYAPLDADKEDTLLGWIAGDAEPTAVALRPDYGDDGGYSTSSLVLVDHDGDATTVGTVEPGTADVTVATGLMSVDRPTVPAGASPWARSWLAEHWLLVVGVVVALGLLILIAVRARLVRR